MTKGYKRIDPKCLECGISFETGKKLTNHILSVHRLSAPDYTVKHFYGGIKPTCPICKSETRYSAFSYKKFCKDHSSLAMKEGGSVGGKAEAWNKGKTKEDDARLSKQALSIRGEGNHFYGRHHSQEALERISRTKILGAKDLAERINSRSQEFQCLTPLGEYSSRQAQYLVFKCNVCGEEQRKTLQAFERGSRCYKCEPISKSNWELEVWEHVKSLSDDTISGDRTVLGPKEIDVYVPSKKLGVECHGLYWHSESRPDADVDPKKHLKKLELAASKGVRLVQIFYDEWRDKRDLCQAMISYRLGFPREHVKTWSTSTVELASKEYQEFFELTHISGSTPAKIAWGLKDRGGRIVAALSLRAPRHKARYEGQIEVARFSTLPGASVPGGLSKLLKAAKSWSRQQGYTKIMTYVDRRIGTGDGWIKAGFVNVGSTAPDYWYTDFTLRYDRFKFRANDGIPEKQVALQAGVSRIWGCGSHVMLLNLDT